MRSRPVSASTTTPLRMSSASRLRLQDRAGDREHVGAQRLAGLPARLAADAGRARRPGAAAVGRVVGVAGDDAHALDRHAERGRHHCAITASAPWPCSVTPVWQITAPVASSFKRRAVLRRRCGRRRRRRTRRDGLVTSMKEAKPMPR